MGYCNRNPSSIMRRRLIKLLSFLSLLIFFLPFFQACSDESLRDGGPFQRIPVKLLAEPNNENNKKIIFEEAKNNWTLSGYEMALLPELSWLSIFTLMMMSNVIIFVNSLMNRFQLAPYLLIGNGILILIAIVLFLIWCDSINQIRYGFLLYIANSICLFRAVDQELIATSP